MGELIFVYGGKEYRFNPEGDAAPAFEPCANCWQGSGCEVRGACIIDEVAEGDMVVGPALHNATLEQIAAEVERRRTELDAWKVKVDASAAAMPSWAAPMEPVPFDACNEACCLRDWDKGEPRCDGCPDDDFCKRTNWDNAKKGARNPHIGSSLDEWIAEEASNAPESHADEGEPLPLVDWLMGEDEPLAEAHSERVSDPDALLILNVAGVLMRKGVAIDEILLRMLTDI